MRIKGFIFTTDAIFSLVIAGIAVSILLYLSAQPQTIVQAPSSMAHRVMEGLLSMKASQALAAIPSQYSSPFITAGGTSVAQFNGHSSYISTALSMSYPLTVTAWIYPTANPSSSITYPMMIGAYSTNNWGVAFGGSGGLQFCTYQPSACEPVPSLNNRYFISATYTSSGTSLCVNGVCTSASGTPTSTSSPLYIGYVAGSNPYFYGSISNVQIYSASLTSNQISYLYNEGMGGMPLKGASLAGWWPLNGNANDYSGNGNNGVPTNVPYMQTGSIAFPGATVQLNSSALGMLARLYSSGQAAYADMVASSAVPNSTGVFLNGYYAPSLHTSQFNGQSSTVATSSVPSSSSHVSASLWFMATAWPLQNTYYYNMLISDSGSCNTNGFYIASRGVNSETLVSYSGGTNPGDVNLNPIFKTGAWNNIVFVWNSTGPTTSNQTIYVNGARIYNRSVSVPVPALNNAVLLGGGSSPCWGSLYLNGSLVNVQLYDGALSSAQAAQLYREGAQGVPIASANVVGWWPLLGDTYDYSGNYRSGSAQNVAFSNGNYLPDAFSSAYSVTMATVPVLTSNSISASISNVSIGVWR